MRRLAVLLAIALVVGASPAGALEGPCRGLNVPETITCAARRWPVPGGPAKARRIAWCESRYDPRARSGRFWGLFQIGHDLEWPSWLDRFPVMRDAWVRGIFDGRSNALVAIRTAHRIGSWTPWACA